MLAFRLVINFLYTKGSHTPCIAAKASAQFSHRKTMLWH